MSAYLGNLGNYIRLQSSELSRAAVPNQPLFIGSTVSPDIMGNVSVAAIASLSEGERHPTIDLFVAPNAQTDRRHLTVRQFRYGPSELSWVAGMLLLQGEGLPTVAVPAADDLGRKGYFLLPGATEFRQLRLIEPNPDPYTFPSTKAYEAHKKLGELVTVGAYLPRTPGNAAGLVGYLTQE